MSTAATRRPSVRGEPTWEVIEFLPRQGEWTEALYFDLLTKRGAEFVDGVIEVLPVPTESHQLILLAFYQALRAFVLPRQLGQPLTSGIRVKVAKNEFREPDVAFMLAAHASRRHDRNWDGADLAAEVVSGDADDRKRDLVEKPLVYAKAKIPEYWVIDPEEQRIIVYRLARTRYAVHGTFRPGQRATSVLLPGFDVDVTDILSGVGA